MIVGRPFASAFPESTARRAAERHDVLVVEGLQGEAFGPVSFTLESGEVVGIAGAEGNGQALLFDCLAGRTPPKARIGRLRGRGVEPDLHARGREGRGPGPCSPVTADARSPHGCARCEGQRNHPVAQQVQLRRDPAPPQADPRGTVLSMDPTIGNHQVADVLVDGDTILEIRPHIEMNGAHVIDASGMIVMPGFVDTHRHIWEGVLRNIGTDVPLEGRSSYLSHVLHKMAPSYRPEDAYTGNLLSALGAIDAGITTLLDWSHIQASPEHTDATVQALGDSGLRAVFGYGFPWWGKWDDRQPTWFVHAATEHFSSQDQLLTLALAAPGPEFTDFEVTHDHWKLAREPGRGSRPTSASARTGRDAEFERFGRSGVLGPDTTYIHCTTLNDTEIDMIVDSGGTVSLAVPVEMMMGHGMPPIQRFLDRGLKLESQHRRRDQRPERHVQPDAIGARPRSARWQPGGARPVDHQLTTCSRVRHDRGCTGPTGSTPRSGH